ncbi:hypothetical protein LIER_37808 [Lithospermum erythrorhizon]|uniref:Uncharacterized protein n=1 Tax=Lithospermum erythrorhizon TaxID=34254 RepID=A0AAV3PRE0_LITER
MGREQEDLMAYALPIQMIPNIGDLDPSDPNNDYWTEERILMYLERETRISMELSLNENGLSENLQIPSTEKVISDRYYEDWSMVRNLLHTYCNKSGVEWTKKWEVLSIAGYDQCSNSFYNYDPTSELGSSARRRRSSRSESIWLSAASHFGTPSFLCRFCGM